MLTKVLEVGRLTRPPDLYRNFTKQLSQKKGLGLCVNLNPIEYKGIRIFDTPTPDQAHLLLYCDQPGQITGKSPTVNLGLGKKEERKENIEKAFRKFRRFFEGSEKTKDFASLFQENDQKIIEDIQKLSSELEEKGTYLTIIVIDNEKELKPAEFQPFKELFVERALQKASMGGTKGVCHFCGEEKTVSATVNEVFRFATFDKPGFCPSLKKDDALKILPICEECKTDLQNGANLVVQDLSFNFLGNKLWIVPSLIHQNDYVLKRVVEKIKQTREKLKDFASKEKEIERALSDEDQIVHYDFLFMNINQSQQRIELHLTEISPTRLTLLINAAEEATKRVGIDDLPQLTLGLLWDLYEKPLSGSEAKKDYLQLVRSIFYGEYYNLHRFFWYCMRKIRKAIQDNNSTQFREFGWRKLTYASFLSVLYLARLGVFNLRKEESVVNNDELSEFFGRFPEFFNEPWK
ncbi:MAG: TM1802 family CRISPR-associated protein, partial [Pseudothermotoga sp.]